MAGSVEFLPSLGLLSGCGIIGCGDDWPPLPKLDLDG